MTKRGISFDGALAAGLIAGVVAGAAAALFCALVTHALGVHVGRLTPGVVFGVGVGACLQASFVFRALEARVRWPSTLLAGLVGCAALIPSAVFVATMQHPVDFVAHGPHLIIAVVAVAAIPRLARRSRSSVQA